MGPGKVMEEIILNATAQHMQNNQGIKPSQSESQVLLDQMHLFL